MVKRRGDHECNRSPQLRLTVRWFCHNLPQRLGREPVDTGDFLSTPTRAFERTLASGRA